MWGKLFKILELLVVAIFGVLLTNKFNLFSYLTFVPSEHAYEICITVYFAILGSVSELAVNYIDSHVKSELSVILSLPDTETSIDTTPIITFNANDLAEMNINIIINGRKKHFLKSHLKIDNINFATMQASIKSREASTDSKGNYTIDLAELFGETNKKINLSSTFRLTFVKEPIEANKEIEIYPSLINNTWLNINPCVNYKCNHSQIKAKG